MGHEINVLFLRQGRVRGELLGRAARHPIVSLQKHTFQNLLPVVLGGKQGHHHRDVHVFELGWGGRVVRPHHSPGCRVRHRSRNIPTPHAKKLVEFLHVGKQEVRGALLQLLQLEGAGGGRGNVRWRRGHALVVDGEEHE